MGLANLAKSSVDAGLHIRRELRSGLARAAYLAGLRDRLERV